MAEAVIVRFWKRMGQSLGHRWTSSFGRAIGDDNQLTDTARTWLEELGDLTPEQIGKGLEKVARAPADWWPTMGGFRELCVRAPYHAPFPKSRMLEKKPDKDIAKDAIGGLKAMLGIW